MKKAFLKICDIYSYILVFLIFMGQTFLSFKIGSINFNVSRCVMLLVFLLLILGGIVSRDRIRIKRKEMKYVLLFYLVWGLYSVFTIIWSLDIKMYLITNFFIITGIANILFFTFFIDVEKNLKKYFFIIQSTLFINCVYYILIRSTTIGGFYHNTNDLATAITFVFPITVYMLLNSKKLISIIYNLLFFSIYYYSYILISSRANILGIYIGALLTLGVLCLKNSKNIFNDYKLKTIISTAFIILIVIFVNSVNKNLGTVVSKPIENKEEILISEIKEEKKNELIQSIDDEIFTDNNLEIISENTEENLQNDLELTEDELDQIRTRQLYSSNEIRINLIYNTFEFLKKDFKLLTGIGTGNTIYYFKNYSVYSTNYEYSVHNYWLEILLTNGIIVFCGYVISIIIIIKNLVSKVDLSYKIDVLKEKGLVFLFFLLSFIFASISSSSMLTREWIWVAFALIISYVNLNEETSNEK